MALDKVVDSAALDAGMTSVADAIRAKAGTTDPLVWPDGFKAAVESFSGGEANQIDALIDRSISEVNSNVVTVGEFAFRGCKSLISVNLPNAERIGGHVFHSCHLITELDLPKVVRTENYAFQYMASLNTLNLPAVTFMGSDSIAQCNALKQLCLPELADISNSCFRNEQGLERVDFTKLQQIRTTTFQKDSALTVVILRKSDAICTLANINAFEGTPFASGGTGGVVYVPAALIAEYQAATNWSILYEGGTCSFVAIEGSEYE